MEMLSRQQNILLAAVEVSEKLNEALNDRGLKEKDAEAVIMSLLNSLQGGASFVSEPQPS